MLRCRGTCKQQRDRQTQTGRRTTPTQQNSPDPPPPETKPPNQPTWARSHQKACVCVRLVEPAALVDKDAYSPLPPGRAEARSPGLPVSVAAPKTKNKRKEYQETREREKIKQRASGRPNPETPKKQPHNGGARTQKKPGAKRRPQKTQSGF